MVMGIGERNRARLNGSEREKEWLNKRKDGHWNKRVKKEAVVCTAG